MNICPDCKIFGKCDIAEQGEPVISCTMFKKKPKKKPGKCDCRWGLARQEVQGKTDIESYIGLYGKEDDARHLEKKLEFKFCPMCGSKIRRPR